MTRDGFREGKGKKENEVTEVSGTYYIQGQVGWDGMCSQGDRGVSVPAAAHLFASLPSERLLEA